MQSGVFNRLRARAHGIRAEVGHDLGPPIAFGQACSKPAQTLLLPRFPSLDVTARNRPASHGDATVRWRWGRSKRLLSSLVLHEIDAPFYLAPVPAYHGPPAQH